MIFFYVRKNRYCVLNDLVKWFIDHMQPKFTDSKLDKGFLGQIIILDAIYFVPDKFIYYNLFVAKL